jgi:NDP-sugar pyrophosphorylase family protein
MKKTNKNNSVQPVSELAALVLCGGLGSRLSNRRKMMTPELYPHLSSRYWEMIGPKGMAPVEMAFPTGEKLLKPLTDWHLDIHCACPQIKQIVLGLGYQGDIIRNHYDTRYSSLYKQRRLGYLLEKNPAGTLGPIIDLYLDHRLMDYPLVYANGDTLMDINLYSTYLKGIKIALNNHLDLDYLVIAASTLIPWENSSDYGALEFDPANPVVTAFKEKAPFLRNSYLIENGKRFTPTYAGFSVILNPAKLFRRYLSDDTIHTSRLLREGAADYRKNEKKVKYEFIYEKVAADGQMVAILNRNYWSDLGTEMKLTEAEACFMSALKELTLEHFR